MTQEAAFANLISTLAVFFGAGGAFWVVLRAISEFVRAWQESKLTIAKAELTRAQANHVTSVASSATISLSVQKDQALIKALEALSELARAHTTIATLTTANVVNNRVPDTPAVNTSALVPVEVKP